MQDILKMESNSLKTKKNRIKVKKNNRFILIDLSPYNVQSIVSVLFGFGVYCLLVEMGCSWESLVVSNAFKYLDRF